MRANKIETAVRSIPFCSGPPDFFHMKVPAVGLGVFGGFITLALPFTVGLGVLWWKDQGDYFAAVG